MKKDVQFERFTLTERHVKLLRHANVHFCEWAEWGSPSVDCKRPFGNRDMIGDMAEILEIVPVETDDGEKNWPPGTTEQMESLYRELATALQIVLTAGTFVPAVYETERYMPKWRPVAELRESR